MLKRCARIMEKAERDPASHEVVFGAIIYIGGKRSVAHHAISRLHLAEIDETSGQQAALAPPFIGVLMLQISPRGFRRHLGRRCEFIARQRASLAPASSSAPLLAEFAAAASQALTIAT